MFKYEKTAKVGEYIKAYNFKPCPDRQDQFVVGKVIGKYKKTPFGFAAYEVKLMHRTTGNKRNEISLINVYSGSYRHTKCMTLNPTPMNIGLWI